MSLWIYAAAALLALIFAAGVWWWLKSRRPRQRPPLGLTTDVVRSGQLNWRLHSSGKGPYLLLIHGIGANLYCWRPILPFLRDHFRILAVDLPGFGQSDKPRHERYGLDDQVERVVALLDTLHIKRCFVVGNSMGGNIALWLAKQHPERVSGVGVIAPATSPKLVPVSAYRLAWLASPFTMLVGRSTLRWAHGRTVSRKEVIDQERVEESLATYRDPSAVRTFLLATEAIRDPRLPGELRDVAQPVLVLWGSQDKLVSKKVIDALEAALPRAESHVHLGGGHHLQEDEPEWTSKKIVEFFLSKPDEQP